MLKSVVRLAWLSFPGCNLCRGLSPNLLQKANVCMMISRVIWIFVGIVEHIKLYAMKINEIIREGDAQNGEQLAKANKDYT